MQAFLTIAIPTYNRHKFLLEQLQKLVPQTLGLNDVKILVIDNFSDVPVEQFLKNKIELPDTYRIIRNNKNIGIDANILECLKNTDTDWVWTLSDGDYLKADAVSKVRALIQEYYNCLFINLCTSGSFAAGFDEFCEKVVYWGTYAVSYTIFNLKYFRSYLPYYSKFVLTHQGQLFTLLKILSENNELTCYFKELNVIETAPLPKWSKAAFVYDTIKVFPLLISELPGKSKTIKQKLFPKIINMCMGHLLNAYVYEGLSLKNYFLLFVQLMKYTRFSTIFEARLWLIFLTVINKSIYRWARRRSGKKEYQFSNASKELKWNY